jgi:hypothetical protein
VGFSRVARRVVMAKHSPIGGPPPGLQAPHSYATFSGNSDRTEVFVDQAMA